MYIYAESRQTGRQIGRQTPDKTKERGRKENGQTIDTAYTIDTQWKHMQKRERKINRPIDRLTNR